MTRDRVPQKRLATAAGMIVLLAAAVFGVLALSKHRGPPKPVLRSDSSAGALALATQVDGNSPVVERPAPPGQSVPGVVPPGEEATGAAPVTYGGAAAVTPSAAGPASPGPYVPATSGVTPASSEPAGLPAAGALTAPTFLPVPVRPKRTVRPMGLTPQDSATAKDSQPAPAEATPAPGASPATPDTLRAPAARQDTMRRPGPPPPAPRPDTVPKPPQDTTGAAAGL